MTPQTVLLISSVALVLGYILGKRHGKHEVMATMAYALRMGGLSINDGWLDGDDDDDAATSACGDPGR